MWFCSGDEGKNKVHTLVCADFRVQSDAMVAPRTFPAPWSAVEIPGGFRVEDANRLPLAYFYGHDDAHADVLTLDEARRMAENFARLSERVRS
jgi:hypothetical protein